tara:strand:+ start:225 stop:1385 length:1161 start_codon:yes stop_codon:yes gene_type:complete
MKRIVLLLLICITALGCSNNSTFSIEATTDHSDDEKVYLIKKGENNIAIAIDSTEVIEGKFFFSDSIVVPEMHYVFFENDYKKLLLGLRGEKIPPPDYIELVLEPGSIKIKIYKDSIRNSKVTGTKSNDDYNKYYKEANDFFVELRKIQIEARNALKDSLVVSDLNQQFEQMRAKLIDYEVSFITNNNDSYLSSLILQRMIEYNEIELEKAEDIFKNFTDLIQQTSSSKQIKETIEDLNKQKKESLPIGSLAPKFSGPDLNGNIIELDNINSKVIMIDFWASWCAPCRVENSDLVDLNTKYSTDEFQIIGVSLDRDKESWENAINEDKLTEWVHISHVKFWDEPIARLYNITKMPTSYLLNSEKKIIGIDVKGSELDKRISVLLAK